RDHGLNVAAKWTAGIGGVVTGTPAVLNRHGASITPHQPDSHCCTLRCAKKACGIRGRHRIGSARRPAASSHREQPTPRLHGWNGCWKGRVTGPTECSLPKGPEWANRTFQVENSGIGAQ